MKAKMFYNRILILMICLVWGTSTLSAQSFIRGRVINAQDGATIAGSSIKWQNGSTAVLADKHGGFEIMKGISDSILIISSVGFNEKRMLVKDINDITVELQADVRNIQEVEVFHTGYQSVPKERATGVFESIDMDKLAHIPSVSILERLDGNSSVLFDKGGRSIAMTVRGLSTISGNNNPLIVLDNFPYDGNLSNINPSDVETVTILKDAAASSIWGSRAGNGVIVITTKSGKLNSKIQASIQSMLQIASKPDLGYINGISSKEVLDVERFLFDNRYYNASENSVLRPFLTPFVENLIAHRNGEISDPELQRIIDDYSSRNYRDEFERLMYREARNQQYNIAISGGSSVSSFRLSARVDENVNHSDSRTGRQNFRLNNRILLTDKIHVNWDVVYNLEQSRSGKPYFTMVRKRPYYRLQDEDGNPIGMPEYRQRFLEAYPSGYFMDWNQYLLTDHEHSLTKGKDSNLIGTLGLQYAITDWLKLDALYRYERGNQHAINSNDPESYFTRLLYNTYTEVNLNAGTSVNNIPYGSIVNDSYSKLLNHNARLNIDVEKSWGMHNLKVLLGGEITNRIYLDEYYRNYGVDERVLTISPIKYSVPFINPITNRSAYIPFVNSKGEINNRFVSQFFNGSYSYDNRYVVSASARKDGSNRFGMSTNDKWQPLWSVGGKWNLSNESFYRSRLFERFSLRGSYGVSGTVDQSKSALMVIIFNGNNSDTNFMQGGILQYSNPELRWEKSLMLNLGLEFSMLKGGITGSIDYFNKKGKDLFGLSLADYTAVPMTSLSKNIASIDSHGVDVQLAGRYKKDKFIVGSNFLISVAKEKVVDYFRSSDNASSNLGSGTRVAPVLGEPIYAIRTYAWAGLNEKGEPQGILNGEKTTDYTLLRNADLSTLTLHGSAVPIISGYFNPHISYGNWSLLANISYKLGHYFIRRSINYSTLNTMAQLGQGTGDYQYRWQKPGDEAVTDVPAYYYPANSNRENFYQNSDVLVEKGDLVRLRNINLSYRLPRITYGKRSFNVDLTANATNLGLLWKANKAGLDPEYIGDESYPAPLSFSLGFNVTFN